MSQLNLVLPGIIWPEIADYEYLIKQLDIHNLSKLCTKAKLQKTDFYYSDFIYGNNDYSAASLAPSYAKKLNIAAEFSSFLMVEPTHLRADRDRLLIAEAELLQLNTEEAELIINAINQHFSGELKLYLLEDDLWLLGTNLDLTNLVSYPIIDIVGENIDDFLPQGKSRLALHKILNEIQMLLFNLPLNQQRQDEGLMMVNSLWFWDKKRPKQEVTSMQVIQTNQQLKQQIININSLEAEEKTLIINNGYFAARYRDSFAWTQQINQFEYEVASKLLKLLSSRKLRQINILIPGLDGGWRLSVKSLDLWCFWRKKTWLELMESISSSNQS
jgi:hypothetical protein